MLRAGDLQHKVTIEQVAEARTDRGAVSETWSTFATVFADIRPISGREYLQGETINSEITHRVYIRALSGVRAKMRIAWNGREFEIMAPPMEQREAGDLMTLFCKEINP